MRPRRSPSAHPRAPRHRVVTAAAVTAASLGLAAPALAEPALPRLPASGAVVGTVRPTFGWTAGSSGVPIARYEVFVETPAGALKVADAPAGTLSATSAMDLADDARHRWFVRITNTLGGVASTPVADRAEVSIATPAAAPTIVDGPAGTTAKAVAAFRWIGNRAGSRWAVQDATGAVVQSGELPGGGGAATLAALPDGTYVFRVAQRNAAGIEGAPAARGFTVDTTPPATPTPATPGSGQSRTTPAFSWRSPEPGVVTTWRVRGLRGAVVSGPAETTATRVIPPPLPPGAYVFEVRQTDGAGNVGPWGSEPFSIVPRFQAPSLASALSAGGTPASIVLLRRNTRLMTPRAGTALATARPVLRWRGGPAGTALYNLQLFRVTPRGRLVKIGAAFPSGTRYTLPRGTALGRGACYVWRVWPYRGDRYTATPLGTSDFCVRR